ncbi:uncharacterized protein [Haliotis asinina]|uniref:uncharacterized protein n=1 Tax=Haliotis asinina TaxID=109174 RepID=UPI0035326662
MFTLTFLVVNYILIACVHSATRMCYVKTLGEFEDKRVTDHVLWTEQKTDSLLECVARCNEHDRTLACGYNPNKAVCIAYSTKFTDPLNTRYSHDQGYRLYSLCPGGPALGACETSTDCLVVNTSCLEGACVCDMMFVSSEARGGCFQNCIRYGNTFTRFVGHILRNHNDKKLPSISERACQEACVHESSIVCKTADYNPTSANCFLSSTGWMDAPASSRAADVRYNLHIRNCDV